MIKHIIFDCFGTLIDTGTGSREAVKSILASVGSDADCSEFYRDWKSIKKEMMRSKSFQTEKKLFELSLSDTFIRYNINADASKEVEPMIKSLFGERHAFPDVEDTLQMLEEAGVEYAIGSTTDTDSLLYFLELNGLTFDHIYTSEDMKVYKPDKRFYERILELSGWDKDECLFVGDNIVDDVMGPKSIGMKAVLLDRKGTFDETGAGIKPDYVIHSLKELKGIIRGGLR